CLNWLGAAFSMVHASPPFGSETYGPWGYTSFRSHWKRTRATRRSNPARRVWTNTPAENNWPSCSNSFPESTIISGYETVISLRRGPLFGLGHLARWAASGTGHQRVPPPPN